MTKDESGTDSSDTDSSYDQSPDKDTISGSTQTNDLKINNGILSSGDVTNQAAGNLDVGNQGEKNQNEEDGGKERQNVADEQRGQDGIGLPDTGDMSGRLTAVALWGMVLLGFLGLAVLYLPYTQEMSANNQTKSDEDKN